MGLRVGDENDAQRALGKLVYALSLIFVGIPVFIFLSRYVGLGGAIGGALAGATGGLVGYGLQALLARLFGKTSLGEAEPRKSSTNVKKRKPKALRPIDE